MNEQRNDGYKTPWKMPEDIFWDHGESAELNRLQWIREHHPELTFEEISRIMPFRNEVVVTYSEEKHTTEVIKTVYESTTNEVHESTYRRRLLKLSDQAMKFDPLNVSQIEI